MALKYVGDGSFVTGVPARDLTDDEEAEYGHAFKKREGVSLERTGLYEKTGEHKDKKSEGS